MIYLAILNLILDLIIIFLIIRFMPSEKIKELRNELTKKKPNLISPEETKDINQIIQNLNDNSNR